MAHIFISYRRDDNAIAANAIYKALVQTFGEQDIFFDVHGMPLGVDWEAYLREQVHACRVMLVVIGRDWLTIRDPDTGERRLDQAVDFVRYEIETALQRNIPVIPLFLDGVRMLPAAELPESIQALTKRQGQSIRRAPDFDADLGRLIAQLERMLQLPTPTAMRVSPIQPVLMAKAKPRSLDLPRQGLTSIEWIAIPGKGYGIAKYPLTNAQFKLFMDVGGYTNQQWWTDDGWEAKAKGWEWNHKTREWEITNNAWVQPRYWTDKKWNRPEQPVVGVSWYEAVAYGLWLSEFTGDNVMLPTEDQWQYAAQGDDGREYPWGNDWDCKRCNNSVYPCDSNQTSPVPFYKGKGDSPFEIVDMAGNVWEWCITDYDNGTNDIYSGANNRVLRGGSWYDSDFTNFRCDNRNGGTPRNRYSRRGFRLAFSS